MSIGVLLTSFRRPHTLSLQLAALDAQSAKPDRIVIWHNDGGIQPDTEAMRGREIVACNFNSGVWPRFSFCLWGMRTGHVLILDDDTVPAPRFIEHLLTRPEKALYGVNGVVFPEGTREPRTYVGRDQRSLSAEVDICGHAWFFERSLLAEMASVPRLDDINTAGEDYALCFAAQRRGLRVLIPSTIDPSTRGSLRPELGTDAAALYRTPGEEQKKQRVHDFYLSKGWKPLAFRQKEPT